MLENSFLLEKRQYFHGAPAPWTYINFQKKLVLISHGRKSFISYSIQGIDKMPQLRKLRSDLSRNTLNGGKLREASKHTYNVATKKFTTEGGYSLGGYKAELRLLLQDAMATTSEYIDIQESLVSRFIGEGWNK